jgi:hypothetical protein
VQIGEGKSSRSSRALYAAHHNPGSKITEKQSGIENNEKLRPRAQFDPQCNDGVVNSGAEQKSGVRRIQAESKSL